MKHKQSLSTYNLKPTRFCLDILEMLSEEGIEGMELKAISERIAQPKSTVHRYVKTLEEYGWIESVGGRGHMIWKPSNHFIKLAFSYRNAVRVQIEKIETEFSQLTGEELFND
uniref:helix-turn-helix domain-containing protein n=1 Tax=Vibrio harveyi TaxID=669 RepID=UPI000680122D|nr:helix-turn-helix domain-containing protein [Vibrio harveyi]